jgi:hypothetical protein
LPSQKNKGVREIGAAKIKSSLKDINNFNNFQSNDVESKQYYPLTHRRGNSSRIDFERKQSCKIALERKIVGKNWYEKLK